MDGLAAVEYEATHTAAEMGRDRLLKGQSGDIVVEVRDELSRRVLTVTASMRVERRALLPQPSTPWGA